MYLRSKRFYTLLAIAVALFMLGLGATAAHADVLLCPLTANQNTMVGGVYTPVAGNGSCGAGDTAIQMYIPTNTDYARLEWTGTGLTLGNIGVANATVALTSGAGDQPYYMMTFQDPGDVLRATAGDQMLMLEFQPSTVSGTSMVLDPSTTLFNVYDNDAGTYFLGGQSNAHPLNYWLGLYPALSGDAVTGFRIGEGNAGGCSTGDCSETVTVYSVDVGTNTATPEPRSLPVIGGALLLAAMFRKKLVTAR